MSERPKIDRNEYGWQSKVRSSTEADTLPYGDETFADVIFLVGPNKEEILGHKPILYTRSLVLHNSFLGHFAQNFDTCDGKTYQMIEAPGELEPRAFKAFLRFLYTYQLEIEPEIAMGMLFAAKFYMVTMLEELTRDHIQKNLNHQTIFMFYKQASRMKDDQALEACHIWIDANAKDFFESKDFYKLDKILVCSLLARDSLMIHETDVFKAIRCESVAYTHKKLRNALCDVLPLVRFPLMTMEEFWDLKENDVLEKREILDINRYFRGGPNPGFLIVPRNFSNASFVEMPNGEILVRRFKSISRGELAFPKNIYVGVAFKVDRTIEILGFGIYGAKSGSGTYSGVVWGNAQVCKFYFKQMLRAYPHSLYDAQVMLSGPPTYCGDQGLEKIVCQTSSGPVTFTFEDYNGYVYDLKVLTGQVPEIIFRLVK